MLYLKKYGKYALLGGLVVVLFIVLFQNSQVFRFALRNLFFTKKIRLEDTVLRIKEANPVSKWITAEYYGEVIYSYGEYKAADSTRLDSVDYVKYDSLINLASFYVWKDSAERFYQHWHTKALESKSEEESAQNFTQIMFDPLFEVYHRLIGFKKKERAFQFINREPLHSPRYRRRVTRDLSKKEKKLIGSPKKELALLGRGWVKAGFNLEGLERKQLDVEQKGDTLFLEGMPNPVIMTSSINPWFVPDKILGYEIVFKKQTSKLTSEDIKQVKLGCVRKLEHDALESGLMEHAWESAENSLLSMIKMLGREDVSVVVLRR